jgi:hypothetical protein
MAGSRNSVALGAARGRSAREGTHGPSLNFGHGLGGPRRVWAVGTETPGARALAAPGSCRRLGSGVRRWGGDGCCLGGACREGFGGRRETEVGVREGYAVWVASVDGHAGPPSACAGVGAAPPLSPVVGRGGRSQAGKCSGISALTCGFVGAPVGVPGHHGSAFRPVASVAPVRGRVDGRARRRRPRRADAAPSQVDGAPPPPEPVPLLRNRRRRGRPSRRGPEIRVRASPASGPGPAAGPPPQNGP